MFTSISLQVLQRYFVRGLLKLNTNDTIGTPYVMFIPSSGDCLLVLQYLTTRKLFNVTKIVNYDKVCLICVGAEILA